MSTFEGHVYLDHHYPPVIWNIARGGFDSIDLLPDREKACAISVSLSSMLQNSSVKRLTAEISLELVRRTVAPDSVSRLRGVFVFNEVESVSKIWESNNWGGHFIDEYLADVGVCARKLTRVDAAWIADIIGHEGQLLPDWGKAAINYWSGLPRSQTAPIWEVIVDGRFSIWSMHSKQSAVQEITALWPNSLGLLVHSMNCFSLGSLDGQTFPGLISKKTGVLLDHYLRMVDSKDTLFIEKIRNLPKTDPNSFAGHPDFSRMHLPDLTGFSKYICSNDDANITKLLALL